MDLHLFKDMVIRQLPMEDLYICGEGGMMRMPVKSCSDLIQSHWNGRSRRWMDVFLVLEMVIRLWWLGIKCLFLVATRNRSASSHRMSMLLIWKHSPGPSFLLLWGKWFDVIIVIMQIVDFNVISSWSCFRACRHHSETFIQQRSIWIATCLFLVAEGMNMVPSIRGRKCIAILWFVSMWRGMSGLDRKLAERYLKVDGHTLHVREILWVTLKDFLSFNLTTKLELVCVCCSYVQWVHVYIWWIQRSDWYTFQWPLSLWSG